MEKMEEKGDVGGSGRVNPFGSNILWLLSSDETALVP